MLDSLKALMAVPLFAGLAAADLQLVAQRARQVHVPAATALFRRGERAADLIVVQRGRIQISNRTDEGEELIIAIAHPGEVLGELALFDEHARSADAVTLEPCDLLVLQRADLMPLFERNPTVCLHMLRILAGRLRRTTARLEEFVFLELSSRMARELLRLAETDGRVVQGGVRIGLALSQQQLASLVGAARESVNRQLRRWERAGLIAVEKGWLIVCDRKALQALAGEPVEAAEDRQAVRTADLWTV